LDFKSLQEKEKAPPNDISTLEIDLVYSRQKFTKIDAINCIYFHYTASFSLKVTSPTKQIGNFAYCPLENPGFKGIPLGTKRSKLPKSGRNRRQRSARPVV
jgi:hypothetical protein